MHLSWLVKAHASARWWNLITFVFSHARECISGDDHIFSFVLWMNFKWDINDNKLRGYISRKRTDTHTSQFRNVFFRFSAEIQQQKRRSLVCAINFRLVAFYKDFNFLHICCKRALKLSLSHETHTCRILSLSRTYWVKFIKCRNVNWQFRERAELRTMER